MSTANGPALYGPSSGGGGSSTTEMLAASAAEQFFDVPEPGGGAVSLTLPQIVVPAGYNRMHVSCKFRYQIENGSGADGRFQGGLGLFSPLPVFPATSPASFFPSSFGISGFSPIGNEFVADGAFSDVQIGFYEDLYVTDEAGGQLLTIVLSIGQSAPGTTATGSTGGNAASVSQVVTFFNAP